MREVMITLILLEFDWENHFFEEYSWFKFNNLRLVSGMALKFYTSVAKELKLKVREFWKLISAFAEITGEKLVGQAFLRPSPPSPLPE